MTERAMRPYTYEEHMRVWMCGHSGRDDAEALRAGSTRSNDAKAALDRALATVKAAGYRVSRPKTPKSKGRVGPTFVCKFADGTVTRMSVFTSLEKLDWGRGVRLSQAAYQSRWRTHIRKQTSKPCLIDIAPVPPAIVSARFERNGVVLAQRNGGAVS